MRAVRLIVTGSVIASAVSLSGCGGGDPPPDLSARALEGRSLALSSGCSACHGKNGEGGVGPPWLGLADSEVRFKDSTTAVADSGYLSQSIEDPSARLREGYTVKMPQNGLTVEEIKKVVAYIQELR